MLSESLYLLHSPLLLLLIKMCPFFNPPPPVVKKKLCQWCHRGAVVSQLRSDKDAAMNRPSHWDILEHGVQTDREATANVCCGEVRIKNRFFFLASFSTFNSVRILASFPTHQHAPWIAELCSCWVEVFTFIECGISDHPKRPGGRSDPCTVKTVGADINCENALQINRLLMMRTDRQTHLVLYLLHSEEFRKTSLEYKV